MTSADPEAAYFQGVEEFFVSRRGDPLMLSNADWLLVKRWRSQATPLRIVLRGIADALDSHAHSWSRDRKVASLRYCEAEVDRARERWERALAEGSETEGDLGRSLAFLAGALASARLGPKAAAIAPRLGSEIGSLGVAGARPRDVEPKLQAVEAELLEAIAGDAPEVDRDVRSQVDAALAAYRSRLPAKVFDALREQSRRRELLSRHGLPRLSLFEVS